MATTLILNKSTKDRLRKIIGKPFNNIRQFFAKMALMIDRDVQLTFRNNGARGESPRWRPLSMRTVRTPAGTARIRYGTDGTPTPLNRDALRSLRSRWGWGRTGEMRKGVRRYQSRTNELLQASGAFKRSFGIIRLGKNSLMYGTKYKLAESIMSPKSRNVLFITRQDEEKYAAQFRRWYLMGLA